MWRTKHAASFLCCQLPAWPLVRRHEAGLHAALLPDVWPGPRPVPPNAGPISAMSPAQWAQGVLYKPIQFTPLNHLERSYKSVDWDGWRRKEPGEECVTTLRTHTDRPVLGENRNLQGSTCDVEGHRLQLTSIGQAQAAMPATANGAAGAEVSVLAPIVAASPAVAHLRHSLSAPGAESQNAACQLRTIPSPCQRHIASTPCTTHAHQR